MSATAKAIALPGLPPMREITAALRDSMTCGQRVAAFLMKVAPVLDQKHPDLAGECEDYATIVLNLIEPEIYDRQS